MSEYQYYYFKAIDRPLTKTEMSELRSISTRAVITSTSFTNHYEWGDLKADPLELLTEYFDAFVYVTNWGTREFYLRLPQELVDSKLLKTMLPRKTVKSQSSEKFVILAFKSEGDPDEEYWDDDDSEWMGSLISLRSDLLRGDLRCLYLGWLFRAQHEEFDETALEPTVPAGLRELSAPLDSLVDFLGIDEDLIEAAAVASAPLKAGPSRKELATWIQELPEKEKNNLLVAATLDSGEQWRNELLRRFQQRNSVAAPPNARQRRTTKDLLTAASARANERAQQLKAKRAAEEARQKAKEEANRALYLDQLAKRKKAVWKEVENYIQKRQPNDYDRAVRLLTDLHDLAVRQEDETGFQLITLELRETHAAKESFLRRLTKANL